MSQIKFDVKEFEEKINKMEEGVTELSELSCIGIPCESITTPSIDRIISVYEGLEQKMDNYILSLENMIESMNQVKDTFVTIDCQWTDVINV